MIARVRATIEEYNMIESGDTVFAAVSGGADSVCLLLVLLELKDEVGFEVEAIHVEHGIRGKESLRDAEFVQDLCLRMGVKCHFYNVDAIAFAREKGYSQEEAARILRYDCFGNHTASGKVAVAHNMEDNAETMLYNMVRGTGIEGLRGIKKVRGAIIRPLRDVRRRDIELYLLKRGQDYCTDSTNSDTSYDRNKIRHDIIPILGEINSSAIEHLNNLSRLQDEAVDYINRQVEKAYNRYVSNDIVSRQLLNEELIIASSVIHRFLAKMSTTAKDIGSVHIDAVLDLMRQNSGRQANLPYDMVAIADSDGVRIMKKSAESAKKIAKITPRLKDVGDRDVIEVNGAVIILEVIAYKPSMEIISKNYTKMLDYDKIISELSIRSRQDGDYIVINSQGSTKSINRLMIDSKIPRENRDNVILLCDGSHVMYVVGLRISEHYKIDDKTTRVLRIDVTGER